MIIYDHIMFHHSSLKRILGRFAHLAAALQCVSNARLKEWSLDTWKNDPPHGLMEIKFLTDINWYQAIRDINNDSHHCWLFLTSHHLAATTLRGAWMASTCYLWGGFWEVCSGDVMMPSNKNLSRINLLVPRCITVLTMKGVITWKTTHDYSASRNVNVKRRVAMRSTAQTVRLGPTGGLLGWSINTRWPTDCSPSIQFAVKVPTTRSDGCTQIRCVCGTEWTWQVQLAILVHVFPSR